VRLLRTDIDLGIDTDKAALIGVPVAATDRTVRLAVAGLAASRFREADGDEYDITLRLPMDGRQTLSTPDQIQIGTASGGASLDAAIEQGGRGAVPADSAHGRNGDRRPHAARRARIRHLLAARDRDRDHRRADLIDLARAARNARDV
jgi:hypothetical protein